MANWQLYYRMPFRTLHQSNPDIIQLPNIIGWSRAAIAIKARKFASLNPALIPKGLAGASKADHALWNAFMENCTAITEQAETLYETKVLGSSCSLISINEIQIPQGKTETLREVKIRRVQRFFRQIVLESYNNGCTISGLAIPELLVASHIIPWAKNETRRAEPTSGITLNVIYDKAFDRNLISSAVKTV